MLRCSALWAWPGCYTHELIVTVVTHVSSLQDQLSQNSSQDVWVGGAAHDASPLNEELLAVDSYWHWHLGYAKWTWWWRERRRRSWEVNTWVKFRWELEKRIVDMIIFHCTYVWNSLGIYFKRQNEPKNNKNQKVMPSTVKGSVQCGQMEIVLFLLGFPLGNSLRITCSTLAQWKGLSQIPNAICRVTPTSVTPWPCITDPTCHTVAMCYRPHISHHGHELETLHITLWPCITDSIYHTVVMCYRPHISHYGHAWETPHITLWPCITDPTCPMQLELT